MWPYKVTCTHTHFPLYQVYIIKFLVKCRLCVFCSLLRFETSWLRCKMTKCTFNIIIMQSQNLQNVVIKLDSLICRKWTLLIKEKKFGNHNCSSEQFSTNHSTILPLNEARIASIFSICFSSPHSALPWLTRNYTKFHAWMCAIVL